MGPLFSRFRRKQTTVELLEDIDKEINRLERNRKANQNRQKQFVTSLLIYSIAAYVIAALIFFCVCFPETWQLRLLYSVPLLIFPVLVWLAKVLLHWYFVQRISSNDTALEELRDRKNQILEDVMDTETYKKARDILEKFDSARLHQLEGLPETTDDNMPGPAKVRPADAGTAGTMIQQRTFRTAEPFVVRTHSSSIPALQQQNGAPHLSSPLVPDNLAQAVHPAQAMMGPEFAQPPRPPMPRTVLPMERGVMDKLMDYLVGDGPENRYALICQQCYSHNGMALKEEFEYLSFRCCYCFWINTARKQRPTAPRLQFFAPPGMTAAADNGDTAASDDESDDDKEADDSAVNHQNSSQSGTSECVCPAESPVGSAVLSVPDVSSFASLAGDTGESLDAELVDDRWKRPVPGSEARKLGDEGCRHGVEEAHTTDNVDMPSLEMEVCPARSLQTQADDELHQSSSKRLHCCESPDITTPVDQHPGCESPDITTPVDQHPGCESPDITTPVDQHPGWDSPDITTPVDQHPGCENPDITTPVDQHPGCESPDITTPVDQHPGCESPDITTPVDQHPGWDSPDITTPVDQHPGCENPDITTPVDQHPGCENPDITTPVDQHPGCENPDITTPVDQHPGWENPDITTPVDQHPGCENPDITTPVDQHPGCESPDITTPVDQHPGCESPDITTPVDQHPGCENPDITTPVDQHPGWENPDITTPVDQHPGWEKPDITTPVDQHPGWENPDITTPVDQHPGWENPDITTPVDQHPGWENPDITTPVDQHPGTQEPEILHTVMPLEHQVTLDSQLSSIEPLTGDTVLHSHHLSGQGLKNRLEADFATSVELLTSAGVADGADEMLELTLPQV